jgi:signal transduction histidine kinase
VSLGGAQYGSRGRLSVQSVAWEPDHPTGPVPVPTYLVPSPGTAVRSREALGASPETAPAEAKAAARTGRAGPAITVARVLGPVFSARTWLAMVYLVSGLFIAVFSFVMAVVGIVLGVGLLPVALIGLPVLVFTLVGCGYYAELERRRAVLMLDQAFASPAKRAPAGPALWQRARAILLDPVRWRQAAGAVLVLPVTVVGFAVATSAWSISLALIVLPAYNSDLPQGGASAFGWVLKGTPALVGAVLAGIVLGLLAPHVTTGIAAGQLWFERKLLGPTRRQSRASLTTRVGDLERSRERMVVAADSERRRIERDLHDGAQARLVSLAMELGRAKARFAEDPEGAKALLDQAHEEAKAALVELRGLVRGVHPPVLSDRGLDAALSGLAALCPVPVTVTVEMAARPPSTVEAVAYFVVAEALTNVAKHSGARSAAVDVRCDGVALHLWVRDDGRGGARPDGAGLVGLADRVQAVDGRLGIVSPPGGPTIIEVELPCAS